MRTPDPARHRREPQPSNSLSVRLAWFVGLWGASIAFLGVIAYGIRFWLGLG